MSEVVSTSLPRGHVESPADSTTTSQALHHEQQQHQTHITSSKSSPNSSPPKLPPSASIVPSIHSIRQYPLGSPKSRQLRYLWLYVVTIRGVLASSTRLSHEALYPLFRLVASHGDALRDGYVTLSHLSNFLDAAQLLHNPGALAGVKVDGGVSTATMPASSRNNNVTNNHSDNIDEARSEHELKLQQVEVRREEALRALASATGATALSGSDEATSNLYAALDEVSSTKPKSLALRQKQAIHAAHQLHHFYDEDRGGTAAVENESGGGDEGGGGVDGQQVVVSPTTTTDHPPFNARAVRELFLFTTGGSANATFIEFCCIVTMMATWLEPDVFAGLGRGDIGVAVDTDPSHHHHHHSSTSSSKSAILKCLELFLHKHVSRFVLNVAPPTLLDFSAVNGSAAPTMGGGGDMLRSVVKGGGGGAPQTILGSWVGVTSSSSSNVAEVGTVAAMLSCIRSQTTALKHLYLDPLTLIASGSQRWYLHRRRRFGGGVIGMPGRTGLGGGGTSSSSHRGGGGGRSFGSSKPTGAGQVFLDLYLDDESLAEFKTASSLFSERREVLRVEKNREAVLLRASNAARAHSDQIVVDANDTLNERAADANSETDGAKISGQAILDFLLLVVVHARAPVSSDGEYLVHNGGGSVLRHNEEQMNNLYDAKRAREMGGGGGGRDGTSPSSSSAGGGAYDVSATLQVSDDRAIRHHSYHYMPSVAIQPSKDSLHALHDASATAGPAAMTSLLSRSLTSKMDQHTAQAAISVASRATVDVVIRDVAAVTPPLPPITPPIVSQYVLSGAPPLLSSSVSTTRFLDKHQQVDTSGTLNLLDLYEMSAAVFESLARAALMIVGMYYNRQRPDVAAGISTSQSSFSPPGGGGGLSTSSTANVDYDKTRFYFGDGSEPEADDYAPANATKNTTSSSIPAAASKLHNMWYTVGDLLEVLTIVSTRCYARPSLALRFPSPAARVEAFLSNGVFQGIYQCLFGSSLHHDVLFHFSTGISDIMESNGCNQHQDGGGGDASPLHAATLQLSGASAAPTITGFTPDILPLPTHVFSLDPSDCGSQTIRLFGQHFSAGGVLVRLSPTRDQQQHSSRHQASIIASSRLFLATGVVSNQNGRNANNNAASSTANEEGTNNGGGGGVSNNKKQRQLTGTFVEVQLPTVSIDPTDFIVRLQDITTLPPEECFANAVRTLGEVMLETPPLADMSPSTVGGGGFSPPPPRGDLLAMRKGGGASSGSGRGVGGLVYRLTVCFRRELYISVSNDGVVYMPYSIDPDAIVHQHRLGHGSSSSDPFVPSDLLGDPIVYEGEGPNVDMSSTRELYKLNRLYIGYRGSSLHPGGGRRRLHETLSTASKQRSGNTTAGYERGDEDETGGFVVVAEGMLFDEWLAFLIDFGILESTNTNKNNKSNSSRHNHSNNDDDDVDGAINHKYHLRQDPHAKAAFNTYACGSHNHTRSSSTPTPQPSLSTGRLSLTFKAFLRAFVHFLTLQQIPIHVGIHDVCSVRKWMMLGLLENDGGADDELQRRNSMADLKSGVSASGHVQSTSTALAIRRAGIALTAKTALNHSKHASPSRREKLLTSPRTTGLHPIVEMTPLNPRKFTQLWDDLITDVAVDDKDGTTTFNTRPLTTTVTTTSSSSPRPPIGNYPLGRWSNEWVHSQLLSTYLKEQRADTMTMDTAFDDHHPNNRSSQSELSVVERIKDRDEKEKAVVLSYLGKGRKSTTTTTTTTAAVVTLPPPTPPSAHHQNTTGASLLSPAITRASSRRVSIIDNNTNNQHQPSSSRRPSSNTVALPTPATPSGVSTRQGSVFADDDQAVPTTTATAIRTSSIVAKSIHRRTLNVASTNNMQHHSSSLPQSTSHRPSSSSVLAASSVDSQHSTTVGLTRVPLANDEREFLRGGVSNASVVANIAENHRKALARSQRDKSYMRGQHQRQVDALSRSVNKLKTKLKKRKHQYDNRRSAGTTTTSRAVTSFSQSTEGGGILGSMTSMSADDTTTTSSDEETPGDESGGVVNEIESGSFASSKRANDTSKAHAKQVKSLASDFITYKKRTAAGTTLIITVKKSEASADQLRQHTNAIRERTKLLKDDENKQKAVAASQYATSKAVLTPAVSTTAISSSQAAGKKTTVTDITAPSTNNVHANPLLHRELEHIQRLMLMDLQRARESLRATMAEEERARDEARDGVVKGLRRTAHDAAGVIAELQSIVTRQSQHADSQNQMMKTIAMKIASVESQDRKVAEEMLQLKSKFARERQSSKTALARSQSAVALAQSYSGSFSSVPPAAFSPPSLVPNAGSSSTTIVRGSSRLAAAAAASSSTSLLGSVVVGGGDLPDGGGRSDVGSPKRTQSVSFPNTPQLQSHATNNNNHSTNSSLTISDLGGGASMSPDVTATTTRGGMASARVRIPSMIPLDGVDEDTNNNNSNAPSPSNNHHLHDRRATSSPSSAHTSHVNSGGRGLMSSPLKYDDDEDEIFVPPPPSGVVLNANTTTPPSDALREADLEHLGDDELEALLVKVLGQAAASRLSVYKAVGLLQTSSTAPVTTNRTSKTPMSSTLGPARSFDQSSDTAVVNDRCDDDDDAVVTSQHHQSKDVSRSPSGVERGIVVPPPHVDGDGDESAARRGLSNNIGYLSTSPCQSPIINFLVDGGDNNRTNFIVDSYDDTTPIIDGSTVLPSDRRRRDTNSQQAATTGSSPAKTGILGPTSPSTDLIRHPSLAALLASNAMASVLSASVNREQSNQSNQGSAISSEFHADRVDSESEGDVTEDTKQMLGGGVDETRTLSIQKKERPKKVHHHPTHTPATTVIINKSSSLVDCGTDPIDFTQLPAFATSSPSVIGPSRQIVGGSVGLTGFTPIRTASFDDHSIDGGSTSTMLPPNSSHNHYPTVTIQPGGSSLHPLVNDIIGDADSPHNHHHQNNGGFQDDAGSSHGHTTTPTSVAKRTASGKVVVVLDHTPTTATNCEDNTLFGGGTSIISAHSSFAASSHRLTPTINHNHNNHRSSGDSNATTANVSSVGGTPTPSAGGLPEMSLSVSAPTSPVHIHNNIRLHQQQQHPNVRSPSTSFLAGGNLPTIFSDNSMDSSATPNTTDHHQHNDVDDVVPVTPESRFAAAFHKYFLSGDYTIEECALTPEDTLSSIVEKYQKMWGTHRVNRLDIMQANFLAVREEDEEGEGDDDDHDVDTSIKGIPSKILKVPVLAKLESELTSPSVALEPIRARRNTVASSQTPTHSSPSVGAGVMSRSVGALSGSLQLFKEDPASISSPSNNNTHHNDNNKALGRRAHRTGGSRPRLLSLHGLHDHNDATTATNGTTGSGSGSTGISGGSHTAVMSPAIAALPKFVERLGSEVGVSPPIDGLLNNPSSSHFSHLDLHSRAGSERILGGGGGGTGIGRRSRNNLFDLSLHSQAASMAGYSMLSSVDAFSPEFARVLSTSSWQNASHLSTPVVRGQHGMPFMGSLSLVSRRSMSVGEVTSNNNTPTANLGHELVSGTGSGGGGVGYMGLPSMGGAFELPVFSTAPGVGNHSNLNRSVLYSPETPLDSTVLLTSPANDHGPASSSSAAHSKLHPFPTTALDGSVSEVGLVALPIPRHLGGGRESLDTGGVAGGSGGDGVGAFSLASMYGSPEGSQTPRGVGNRTLTSNDVHTAPRPDHTPTATTTTKVPPNHHSPPLLPAADLHQQLKSMGVSELTAFLTDMLGPVVVHDDEFPDSDHPLSTTTTTNEPQERIQLVSRLLRVLNQQPGTRDTNEESFNTAYTSMSPPTAVRFLNAPSSIEHPGTPLKSTTTNDSSFRLPSLVSTTQVHGTPLCASHNNNNNSSKPAKRLSFASSSSHVSLPPAGPPLSPSCKVGGGLLPPIKVVSTTTTNETSTAPPTTTTPSRPVLKSLTKSVVDFSSSSEHHHGGIGVAAASYAQHAVDTTSPFAMKRHLAGGAAFAVRRATIHKPARVAMPTSSVMKGGPGVAVPVISRAPLEDRVKLLVWVERERRQQLLHQTTAAFQKLVDQHHHRWLLELEQYDRECR